MHKLAEIVGNENTMFEMFFTISPDLLSIIDMEGTFAKVNKSWEDIVGLTIEEIEGRKFIEFVHPDDIEATLNAMAVINEQKNILNFTNRYRFKDDSYRYIEWSFQLYGDIIYSVARDITERRIIKDSLIKSKTNLQDAQHIANIGSWKWNLKNREVVWSEEMYNIFGICKDSVLGRLGDAISSVVHPEDLHIFEATNAVPILEKKSFEYRIIWPDNSIRYIWAKTGDCIFDDLQNPIFLMGIVQDITERKLEEELTVRKNLFQKLIADISCDFINATVENIDDKIKNMLEISGDFFDVDKSCILQIYEDRRILKITHQSGKKQIDSITDLMPDFSLNDFPWWEERLRSCEPIYMDDIDTFPEIADIGKEILKKLNIKSILNVQILSNNKLIGILCYTNTKVKKIWGEDQIALLKILANTVSDALAKNKMEKEIIASKEKAEKESSLKSEFFANMSHEFRTPLNIMLGTIQLFELYAKNKENLTSEKTEKHLKAMKQNSFRLLRLVNNLIDISKIDSEFYESAFSNYNIVSIIEKIVLSIDQYAKQKNINVEFKSDLKEKVIKCDVDMIERIMLNLISNSIKFSCENCYIHILITNAEENVVITVKDNGIGIEKDKQNVIFEKYRQVTTTLSRMREGSGIGLSLTKSLIEMHGGTISVKSEYGKGSEFIIEIPNVRCAEEEILLNNFNDTIDNQRFISKMNVEFSDIYI